MQLSRNKSRPYAEDLPHCPSNAPPCIQHHITSEGSLDSPNCPLHKSSVRMKTSNENWWNDTDRGTNEALVPVPRFPKHILTLWDLDRNQTSAMRDRRHRLSYDTASIQHDGYESPRKRHLDPYAISIMTECKTVATVRRICTACFVERGRGEVTTNRTSQLFLKLFFLSSYSDLFHLTHCGICT